VIGRAGLFLFLTLLFTGVFLAGIGATAYWLLLRTLPPEVVVPDVGGLSVVEAQQRLEQKGLGLLVSGEQPSAEVPAGHVIVSKPPPGRRVRRGRNIEVILSTGRELVEVPNVVEQPLESARRRLEQVGLHVGLEQRVWNDLVPEGHVVNQSPAPGIRVEKGSEVVLMVSRGPRPREEEVLPPEAGEVKTALVRVVIPPTPPTQHLEIIVRDDLGEHKVVDRYCSGGDEIATEVKGVGEVVVEVYLNEKLVTRRRL
jgi:serine/threonine-protein kinase